MIQVRGLTKRYPEGVAVDHLSFEVNEGEALVLVGTSGCGKSTTLKMINGLVTPNEGEVLIQGEKLTPANSIPLRHRIGYVIQEGGLFPHLTIFQNISLLARMEGWPQARMESWVNDLLQLVGLNPDRYAQKFPLELSGGEQQRVGVARALMLDPPILLMDEPFGALDPITRRQLQQDFLKIQKQLRRRKTIVFVTHDMREAFLMANRIAVMDCGAIIQIGTPEQIKNQPTNNVVKSLFIEGQE